MENGLSIRNTYEKCQGKFSLKFPLYRLGINKKSHLKIKNIKFDTSMEIENIY
jgi:hypothetical protein